MHGLYAGQVPHFCAFYLAQIAVLKEMDGKGPFCSLVMAVVVVKDVIVIIAFALNIELIRSVSAMGWFLTMHSLQRAVLLWFACAAQ